MITTSTKKKKAAESYRKPALVTHLRIYGTTVYYICPNCNITMEREFMSFCDRCGQRLNWKEYKKALVIK